MIRKTVFLAAFLPLFAFAELDQYLLKADVPVLIGGTVVDRKDYPATIWIGVCTASVVGPRSVLVAAHCATGGSASFTLGSDKYTSECVTSNQYPKNTTADYAYCYTDREVKGIPFENVNIDPTHVVKGDWILQSGFGCTVWGGRIDGQLRVGKSQVLGIPSGTSNDYTTGNGAVLCSGDSGGPAWSLTPEGNRNMLISVNSRSNTTSRSYLSAMATAEGIRFTKAFMDKYGAQVCGVSDHVVGCRTLGPAVPIDFVVENDLVKLTVTLNPGASYSKADLEAALKQSIESVR